MYATTEQNTSTHTTVSFFTSYKLRRLGGHKMVVLPETPDTGANNNNVEFHPGVNEHLVKALIKATLWERQLRSSKITLKELVQREGVSDRYVQHILRLNFLSPDLKEAILEGRQPEGLNLEAIRLAIPLVWEEQRQQFSFYHTLSSRHLTNDRSRKS